MSGFVYRPSNPAAIQRVAAGVRSDFEGFLRDDITMYKPRSGDNSIRIMPPSWDGAEYYGLHIHVHYGLGPDRGSALCLNKMGGSACPICEERAVAERAADTDLAMELRPIPRTLVWVLDRFDEDAGLQAWAMPHSLDRDIAAASQDKQDGTYYQIDDPVNGYDVMFNREGTQRNTKYLGVQIARRATSVDPGYLDLIMQNPLPDILVWKDYAQVRAIYEGGARAEPNSAPRNPAPGNNVQRPAPAPAPHGAPRVAAPSGPIARPVTAPVNAPRQAPVRPQAAPARAGMRPPNAPVNARPNTAPPPRAGGLRPPPPQGQRTVQGPRTVAPPQQTYATPEQEVYDPNNPPAEYADQYGYDPNTAPPPDDYGAPDPVQYDAQYDETPAPQAPPARRGPPVAALSGANTADALRNRFSNR